MRRHQTMLCLTLVLATGVSLIAVRGIEGLLGALLAAAMLAIAVTDLRRYIIPDQLTAAAGALALLRAGVGPVEPGWPAMIDVVLRAAFAGAPFLLLMIGYRYWRGRDGLGLGDVKLAAVAGAWLEWTTIFIVIEAATLVALAAYVASGYVRQRRPQAAARLPFGLFLAPAIWIGWLVQTLLR